MLKFARSHPPLQKTLDRIQTVSAHKYKVSLHERSPRDLRLSLFSWLQTRKYRDWALMLVYGVTASPRGAQERSSGTCAMLSPCQGFTVAKTSRSSLVEFSLNRPSKIQGWWYLRFLA